MRHKSLYALSSKENNANPLQTRNQNNKCSNKSHLRLDEKDYERRNSNTSSTQALQSGRNTRLSLDEIQLLSGRNLTKSRPTKGPYSQCPQTTTSLADLEKLQPPPARASFFRVFTRKWSFYTEKMQSKFKQIPFPSKYVASKKKEIVKKAFKIWDTLIILIHLFNLLVVPMTLAWAYEFYDRLWLSIFYVCDAALLVNFYFNVTRPFFDEYGAEVTDPKLIRKHYFMRNFGAYELVGAIPFDLICFFKYPDLDTYKFGISASFLSYAQDEVPIGIMVWAALRLTRFLAMLRYLFDFSDWNFPNIHVAYSRLVKNLLGFLWIAHFNACLFWALCYFEDSPSSWINTSGVGFVDGDRIDSFTQYLFAFLASQRTLFFSFRDTKTSLESAYSVLELIVGAIINGSILGNITNLIQSMDKNAGLDKKEEKHNFKMTHLKAYMKKRHFSTELQIRVRNHNEFEWIRNRGMDEEKLFGGLPKSLKQEVADHLYMDLLNSMPLFKSCDSAFKASLSREMRTITIDKGVYVFRKGDDGQEMYFVQNGAVEILKETGEVITEIKAGSFFGQVALFEACKRTATARTKLTSDLCIIKKEPFDKLLIAYPSTAEEIKKSVEEAKQADLKRKREEEAKRLEQEELERKEKLDLIREILKKSKLYNTATNNNSNRL